MTKRNTLPAATLALLMLLSSLGCASSTPETSVPPAAEPASAAPISAPEPAAPLTLTDHLGRQVTLTATPQRVVSGYYITTSLVLALGAGDRLVGVEAKADTRPLYAQAAPYVLTLPSVGSAKDFDLEGCLALEPDLVLLPVKLKESIAALEGLGVTVLAVDPEDDERLYETIELVGQALGSEVTPKLLADLLSRTEALKMTTVLWSNIPFVYMASNSDLLATAGHKMYQSSLIYKAGGNNVARELEDSYWSAISYEQLLAYDPHYIILPPAAAYTPDDVLSDPLLAEMSAVREGRVYQMPYVLEAWDSPLPASILGAEWLCSVLNEQAHPFEQFQQSAVDFYRTYYGIEIDPALLSK